jgi:hypothetical protein
MKAQKKALAAHAKLDDDNSVTHPLPEILDTRP